MCDTLVAVGDDAVSFAKNSDREPGEVQLVEHHERARHPEGARLNATYLTIDQARETHEVVLSRPAWMWGAEMGANEHGLAIGNEAVFTSVPVEPSGLTGMDLVRLALERCKDAGEALDLITWMIGRHGQGGAAGHRNKKFRYHNAFLLADPRGAWLLETAGRFWAASFVRSGIRTTSNVLTIGADYTRLGPGTIEGARSLGLVRRGETFDFRRAFADPVMGWLSGGDVRRACTANALSSGSAGVVDLARALRDHGGKRPTAGARIVAPCAHASFLPTRRAGQTTGSMIAILREGALRFFFTGTSAPCLSVFKPVPLGRGRVLTGDGGDDALFRRHERLHRTVLGAYERRRAAFDAERAALEVHALAATDVSPSAASDLFAEHAARIGDWTARAERVRALVPSLSAAWLRRQS